MADCTFEQILRSLSEVRESSVLSIVLPEEPLLPSHLLAVQESLKGKALESLDIVLHSLGGDIGSAYQIAELTRDRCQRTSVIVPLYAKSAATLLILAADEIIMGETAQVGPLDTQIAEREKGSIRYRSALNPFKSLEQLQVFSLETLDVTVKLMLARAEMTVDEAVGHAIEFASRVSSPLYKKLDVGKLGEYSRALEIGKEYGRRLMERYVDWKDQEQRDAALDKLVLGYPAHDYIIDCKELEALGFQVRHTTDTEGPIMTRIVEFLLKASQTEVFCVCEATPPNDAAADDVERKEAGDANDKGLGRDS